MPSEHQREELRGWFAEQLPTDLFTELVEVTADREEITVVGRIAEPALSPGASATERAAARDAYVSAFRERTRAHRAELARQAQRHFRRKVSWGVECGGTRSVFTHVTAPVMTRLRQPERQVLDTLIAGGVASSRSEALAWCVRLVRRNADGWLSDLQKSIDHVRQVRARGPDAPPGSTYQP